MVAKTKHQFKGAHLTMGVTNSNKQVSVSRIDCDGTFRVTLALTASPDITEHPTDIVLVLDRSGSMAGSPLASMKAGAKKFIDIIDEATDGAQDGHIGSGSRIGVVSFADTAAANTQLITSVADLKAAVDSLTAGGDTNHADAFTKAGQLFDPASTNAKVVVMFTDGKTTTGPAPAPVAAALRASGAVIYAIGLVGSDGIDVATLDQWATDPDASHVAVTPDDADLEELFAGLAANISKPGATNIVIDEVVNSDFAIVSVQAPSKGTAALMNARTIRWSIASLGTSGSEGASLQFLARYVGQSSGSKVVNRSVTYRDDEGNAVTFPSPSIYVDCGTVICPEDDPDPIEAAVPRCQNAVEVDLGDTYMESQGCIVQVHTTIKNVCPGKRTALAVILTEVDGQGVEHARGTKTLVIPAHDHPTCRDVKVKCIKFVLPEAVDDPCLCQPDGSCQDRNLRVRFISHPIESDYQYCNCNVTRI